MIVTPFPTELSRPGAIAVDSYQCIGPTLVGCVANLSYAYGRWDHPANTAVYIPFWVNSLTRFDRVNVFPSAITGNYDVGVYHGQSLARLASSGSTAAANANATQTITFSSVAVCPRGFYYFAWAASSDAVTLTQLRIQTGTTPHLMALGIRVEASALPLPSTATFALPATGDLTVPFFVLLEEGAFF